MAAAAEPVALLQVQVSRLVSLALRKLVLDFPGVPRSPKLIAQVFRLSNLPQLSQLDDKDVEELVGELVKDLVNCSSSKTKNNVRGYGMWALVQHLTALLNVLPSGESSPRGRCMDEPSSHTEQAEQARTEANPERQTANRQTANRSQDANRTRRGQQREARTGPRTGRSGVA